MLDEKDLQAIAALLDSKIKESESRMIGAMDSKIKESESRMIVMMESYFDPKFNLLAERMASAEVVADLDERVSDLEDDVINLKRPVTSAP